MIRGGNSHVQGGEACQRRGGREFRILGSDSVPVFSPLPRISDWRLLGAGACRSRTNHKACSQRCRFHSGTTSQFGRGISPKQPQKSCSTLLPLPCPISPRPTHAHRQSSGPRGPVGQDFLPAAPASSGGFCAHRRDAGRSVRSGPAPSAMLRETAAASPGRAGL